MGRCLVSGQPRSERPIVDLMAAAVRQHRDRIALRCGERVLSYAELALLTARIGEEIERLQRPGDRIIALSLPRGPEFVAAVLAGWQRGLAFVPVDPTYPELRQRFLLEDSRAELLLSQPDPDASPELRRTGQCGDGRPELPLGLAYVLYTSGSTGMPKGCLITHANLAALLDAAQAELDFAATDVWSAVHSFSFDYSVWELWRPLTAGAQVVLVPEDWSVDVEALCQLLQRYRVSVLCQVPPAFQALTSYCAATGTRLPDLRWVLLGGDTVYGSQLATWIEAGHAPNARYLNMYGVTEATVIATWWQVDPSRARQLEHGSPIGHPVSGVHVSLRSPAGLQVAKGEGEIWLCGPSVGAGYLDRPELTAERFVPDSQCCQQFHYRTGDLALADTELLFRGRQDDQVKIGGRRIELGEIEAAVLAAQGVAGCVCVAVPQTARTVIVACVVPVDPGLDLDLRGVRAVVNRRLPVFARPAKYLAWDAFPISGNSKIDRRQLSLLAAARIDKSPGVPATSGAVVGSDDGSAVADG